MPTPPRASTVYERSQKTGFLTGPNDQRFGNAEPEVEPAEETAEDEEPPNLRECDCCGHCANYTNKACDLYGGYPVEPMQVCDSFEASGGAEEPEMPAMPEMEAAA